MNISDAFINAIAVWFVLKTVEVLPLALYDVFIWIQECLKRAEVDSSDYPKLTHRYDKRRGKLEFIFSGAGFLQFSTLKKRKRLFLTASLVPILVFVLEIASIFLGDETRVCQTSRDPNIVKAPALQLFGEGEREIDILALDNEIVASGRITRPCFRRLSTYSGVEYVASICSDILRATSAVTIAKTLFPENERISIVVGKSFLLDADLLLSVFSKESKGLLGERTLVGGFEIVSEVSVNGKGNLISDIAKDPTINETIVQQIRNDVRVLEKKKNSTPSEFVDHSEFFMFEWAEPNDLFVGASNVIIAMMSQSSRVEVKTAAEMSSRNVRGILPELDISCEEDFFLPRKVSIIIITTAAALRLILLAIPTSISSLQYALFVSQKREGHISTAEFTMNDKSSAS